MSNVVHMPSWKERALAAERHAFAHERRVRDLEFELKCLITAALGTSADILDPVLRGAADKAARVLLNTPADDDCA